MIRTISLAAFSVAISLVGNAAFAAPSGSTSATLQAAPPVAVHRVIDGRAWDCFDARCVANGATNAESQPVPRECYRAARELGPFVAYQTGSRSLSEAELAKCNAGAKFLAGG